MLETVKNELRRHGISLCAPIPLSACTVTRPYLLARENIAEGTAFLFAVPYYTTNCDDGSKNISVYAVSSDYHRFFAELFEDVLPRLRAAFPAHRFAGFTDHSPIAECDAAVRAGLGFYGKNHLFITEAHSSFVFLGEIITDAALAVTLPTPRGCLDCGACRRECPVELDITRCLSALTQKKGDLTEEETATLRRFGCAWGCDICQNVCPYTARARAAGTLYSRIPFFENSAMPHLTSDAVRAMDDAAFAERAFSWRGRAVILRNLTLLEKEESE